MTKMSTFILMMVLVVSLIFAGCTKIKTESVSIHTESSGTNTSTSKPSDSNSNTIQSDLVGSVKVENLESDTKITYSFKNQSEKEVTVIGGARYKLLRDNKIVEEGGVPIKDYIGLEPGEEYTDKKTFSNLEPGSYSIYVYWDKTMISAKFVRN
jgi:hypothetical protein